MTPFGLMMRHYRTERNLTLKNQADALGVSIAYLSSLERGMKSKPSAALVDQICVWLGLIWDEAETLKSMAALSHPRPSLDTGNLTPQATMLANILAQNIDRLSSSECREITQLLAKKLNLNLPEIG